MIEVGNIVTLENGVEYLILEELLRTNGRFVYSVRVLPDETPTNEFLIFEAIHEGEGEYLKPIESKDTYDSLVEEFKDVIADKIMSGVYDEMEEVA